MENNPTLSINDNCSEPINDDSFDNHVDIEIQNCIRNRENFFLFAGAGSGKTGSLVKALKFIAQNYNDKLSVHSQKVAVVTYTNAACDEIRQRIGNNDLFAVSTIHSFLWELIKPFQKDIKILLKKYLEKEISELENKQNAPKRRNDYSEDIKKKQKKLISLAQISRFTYSPNGENLEKDSLNHSQVISMGADFIEKYPTMQKVLVSKYPILLIDESQDTKKELVKALLSIENKYTGNFLIGMFGDTMQRIYLDGEEKLPHLIPNTWQKPAKKMNHRSNKRIVRLANSIRNSIDDQEQRPRSDKEEGFVRLFIISNKNDKAIIENSIYTQMSDITGDKKWESHSERKVLVLEHSMAANRLGFSTIDTALRRPFSQSYLDGSIVEIGFLMNYIYPIVEAKKQGDNFTVMKIIREKSPLLKTKNLKESSNQSEVLKKISSEINNIVKLWENDSDPSCIDVYSKLRGTKIFVLPERIEDVLSETDSDSEKVLALRQGFLASFSEIVHYWNYINDKSPFATHQGIKGLQFERVAVIINDEEAGGHNFSYEKLFGTRNLTDRDNDNIKEGKDNSISRTKRLFYVTCTRAKESLAIIAYTNNPQAVKRTVLNNKWFSEDEIVIL
ncbi:MAG: AAA family ATPase [Oscillospiraceae bacterium]|jgi:DNA helicase-2/ATP-dependent DNA helicase PcrA|nr:AAA family ATPase [Oscillospiraceae bacterium]